MEVQFNGNDTHRAFEETFTAANVWMDCVCMELHTRRNGSKVTSISNAMDGSEDDAVWCASDSEESTESVSDMDESDNEL